MRTPCCHTCLAFILKFLNFLQTFIGVSIIIYSAYMLNQWKHHRNESPPTNDIIDVLNLTLDGNGVSINFRSLPASCLVAFIAIDHHWEKDLPFDPTGELEKVRTLFEDNMDVFKWVGIAIITIQALSLLFAIILRSLVSGPRIDDDIEGDYNFRTSVREPLVNPFSSQASGSARGDSDIWSSRIREKYGLNGGDGKHNPLNQSASTDVMQ